MDKFLSMLEKPQLEAVINEEKLKYFISKVSIWDYFGIPEKSYKSSSVEEKTSMLNKYYRELYQKHYGSVNQFYLFVIFGCLLSAIFCLILVLILLLIVCFE